MKQDLNISSVKLRFNILHELVVLSLIVVDIFGFTEEILGEPEGNILVVEGEKSSNNGIETLKIGDGKR